MSDLETSHEGRSVESQQYQERQKKKKAAASKPMKVWYEQVGNKIVKKSKANEKSATTYSTYVGKYTKELWAKVKDKSE
jgi:hypothetical protein